LANTFTNFYPTLWSDTAYLEFAAAAIAPQVVNTTWIDPGGPAEAVRIPKFVYSTSGIQAISSLSDNPTDAAESTLVLNLDQEQGFFFQVKYSEQDKASVALGEAILKQRAAALAAKIDQSIFGPLVSGAANTLIGFLTKARLVSAITILNSGNAPQTDRVLLVNPAGYSDLLNENEFVRADSIYGAQSNMTGFVGKVLGLDVYLSNNLPTTSGDAAVMHRVAFAMAMLRNIDVRVFDQPRHFAVGYTGRAIWGRTMIDSGLIVRISRT
jgi:hypothetical protein